MQTQTIKYVVRFDLTSGEYSVVTHASDFAVSKLVQYLGIEEHHLIPLISLRKQFVQVEFQVPQNKISGLEQKINDIAEHFKQQNWLKEMVILSPTKSDASPAQK